MYPPQGFMYGPKGQVCHHAPPIRSQFQPEAGTFHVDCYQIFIEETQRNAKDVTTKWEKVLWLVTTRRRPWVQCECLALTPRQDVARFTRVVARHIPQLGNMPPEIAHQIFEYLEGTPLSRYCAVLDLIDFVSKHVHGPHEVLSICRVASWRRGQKAQLLSDEHENELPFIRLTTDARGLREIERLEEPVPSTNSKPNDWAYTRYIVERAVVFKGVNAHIKVRLPSPCSQQY